MLAYITHLTFKLTKYIKTNICCTSIKHTIEMTTRILATLFIAFFFLTSLIYAAEDRGSYIVPGLGKRKKAILKNGGGIWDISIAMLETEHLSTNYTYGDGKTYDSANFGIFKQNWFMIRSSTKKYKHYTSNDYKKGTILNKKLKQDIQIRQESQRYYGADRWFGGHRNGETGLNNPYTQDITDYKNAVNWIHDQLNSNPKKYLNDDTRFWVNVHAI